MSKSIRSLVSKRKRRFKEDGYDLDLSYITDQLIAMGFPAQKLEGVYRNHIDDVCRFLEDKHKDHYRIYNLCSERNRSYDVARFHNRVRSFPFADHNPPPLIDIEPLCKDMADWLTDNEKNVAVVHCKAGKGRTGVMICCYLLHSRLKIVAQDALDFYGEKRTLDKKGVTIPSQRRYVDYYSKLVASNFNYNPPYVRLREARMNAPLSSLNSELYLVVSSHQNKKGYNSQVAVVGREKDWIHLPVKEEITRPFSGDIKIELKRTNFVRRTDKLFSAWLNTHFIFEEGKRVTNGCEITASDQNNHNNTCNSQNIRHRSNSFRAAKHDWFRQKRSEAEGKVVPTGLGGSGRGWQGDLGSGKERRSGKGESKSLPTGHLTHLAEEEEEDEPWKTRVGNLSPPLPRQPHRSSRRRRHHTHHLPSVCGGGGGDSWEEGRAEQEVVVILKKNELDKANKDTHHKLLPEDFQLKLWWLVVNKGGGNNAVLESRDSSSTSSTITPSGSSSDDDDDDDDDDEEEEEDGSDWESGSRGIKSSFSLQRISEGSEVLL